jgi:hypothetical protein
MTTVTWGKRFEPSDKSYIVYSVTNKWLGHNGFEIQIMSMKSGEHYVTRNDTASYLQDTKVAGPFETFEAAQVGALMLGDWKP